MLEIEKLAERLASEGSLLETVVGSAREAFAAAPAPSPLPRRRAAPPAPAGDNGSGAPAKGPASIIAALAAVAPRRVTKAQLAFLSGYLDEGWDLRPLHVDGQVERLD